MSKFKNNNHYTIFGWMIHRLGLKDAKLIVYAIVYSFSQDGENRFTGSLQYLADWTSATKQGVMKNLKSLVTYLLDPIVLTVDGVRKSVLLTLLKFLNHLKEKFQPLKKIVSDVDLV